MTDKAQTAKKGAICLPDVVGEFRSYLDKPGNGTWGSLHIVLADGNVDDHHVRFCIKYAHERGDINGERLASLLLSMSRTQRRKLPYAI